MAYLIGAIFILVGVLMTWKARWFHNSFGEILWAEEHVGSTTVFYQIAGVIIVLVGLLIMGGDVQSGLTKIFVR